MFGENQHNLSDAYWTWSTGGSTVYMPTFNKNKDSLEADVNGIYEEGNIGTISDRILDMTDPEAQYSEYTEYTDGQTLETKVSDHEIPNMYLLEDEDFLRSIESGVKNRNNIDNILESMKLLDTLYKSSDEKREIVL